MYHEVRMIVENDRFDGCQSFIGFNLPTSHSYVHWYCRKSTNRQIANIEIPGESMQLMLRHDVDRSDYRLGVSALAVERVPCSRGDVLTFKESAMA